MMKSYVDSHESEVNGSYHCYLATIREIREAHKDEH